MKTLRFVSALVVVLGLTAIAAADTVIYDHFDGTTLDTGKWTVTWGTVPSLSGSVATLNGSTGDGWSILNSNTTFDSSVPTSYWYKLTGWADYGAGTTQNSPYLGLTATDDSTAIIFGRTSAANNTWREWH